MERQKDGETRRWKAKGLRYTQMDRHTDRENIEGETERQKKYRQTNRQIDGEMQRWRYTYQMETPMDRKSEKQIERERKRQRNRLPRWYVKRSAKKPKWKCYKLKMIYQTWK